MTRGANQYTAGSQGDFLGFLLISNYANDIIYIKHNYSYIVCGMSCIKLRIEKWRMKKYRNKKAKMRVKPEFMRVNS